MTAKQLAKILSHYDYENIDIEIWEDVPIDNLKFHYQISNYGRLRNLTTGYMIKPYFTYDKFRNKSRSRFCLYTTDKSIPLKVLRYRLVATVFVKNDDPEHKIEVDHLDGDKTNDHYTNLEWVTPEENRRRETIMKSRPKMFKACEKHTLSKWKNAEIEFICDCIYNKDIHIVDDLYNEYVSEFGNNHTYDETKNLYYNILSKTNPKWTKISKKYKKKKIN